ncbi:TPA: hypothetical protein G8W20_004855 [Salmonella enterica]|uniref:Mobilization protein n=1 Tax=Salmonella enterica TaxID=28901 RepID=A0A758FZ76_SALER|nr:hypothetical protein [Salmonella enterica]
MTKLQKELEDRLEKLLANRESLLAEIKQVRSAVLDDNPKKHKWLTKMIDDVEELDKYITQHQNRIAGIQQRQKLADNRIKRKQDTKRKILLGAMLEKWIEDKKIDKQIVASGLDDFLIRDSDKDLFNDFFNKESRSKK